MLNVHPATYRLTSQQLSDALRRAGIQTSATSGLHDLPPASDGSGLRGSNLLTAQGSLTPEVDAALRVAADPKRILSVLTLFAGDASVRQMALVQSNEASPVVDQRRYEQGWELMLLPTTAQAVVMLDDLLSLTRLPSQPGGQPIDLDLAGYASLVAAADAMQSSRLQARAARTAVPTLALNEAVLEEELEKGLSSTDTRWTVTAARLVAPVDLRLAQGRMGLGLQQLESKGLVQASQGQRQLSRQGLAIAGPLGYLVSASGLVRLVTADGGQATVATLSLYRTMASVWLAMWISLADAAASTVRLMEVSAAGALRLLRGILEPVGSGFDE